MATLLRGAAASALADGGPGRRSEGPDDRDPRDPRAALLGLACWAGAWLGVSLATGVGLALVVVVLLGLWRVRGLPWGQAVAVVLVAGWAAGMLRAESTTASQVAAWAQEGAVARVEVLVTGDPRTVQGSFGPVVFTRAVVEAAAARGATVRGRAPVLVLTDPADPGLVLGQRLAGSARLSAAEGRDLAAMMSPVAPLAVTAEPDVWWRGAAAVREGVRRAVAATPPGPRGLVPALVDGDDGRLPAQVEDDFRTTGLTHLLAVSGTNLTLVSGFLVAVARWSGVRGRGLAVVAAAGIVGFVLLARGEPSVLRAAAMGTVGLLALGTAGRHQGPRAWGVAVAALLLVDPWLARSPGFALSALATAGILWWSPTWRDALLPWLPRWLAEAVAVSSAAQLACTPVVAALSGEVSLVAVAANLLAGPVVGIATVAGLLGGVVVLVVPALGAVLGWGASLAAGWIILVATWTARLPTPAVPWPTGAAGIVLLSLGCLAVAWAAPRVMRSRRTSVVVAAALTVWIVVPPSVVRHVPVLGPASAGTAEGWRVVQCDVGQGDGLLLRVDDHAAVVVDVGGEPDAMADCLRDVGVSEVPRLVLTHFHADHVGGIDGVLDSVDVGEVVVSGLPAPGSGVEAVTRAASRHGVPVRVPALGEVHRDGAVTWQVVGPRSLLDGAPDAPVTEDGAEGSVVNDASLVVLADVAGPGGPALRVLLTGDVEPGGQRDLVTPLAGLDVDVLKVPHHGSAHQDLDFLTGLGAEVAVIGVGENDYGHPAPATLEALQRSGADVGRTDLDGRLVVVRRGGPVTLVRQR
ncbi:ComEC/Rec2 family competence protein [Nocardioidaceae bacterium]|nr:ComEC/Rec2 family competence protein [Nocardioidaceae bacterium]